MKAEKFVLAVIFQSLYATHESLFESVGSSSVETLCLSNAVLWTNWLTIVIHANSFTPIMDAICPQAFLTECVDVLQGRWWCGDWILWVFLLFYKSYLQLQMFFWCTFNLLDLIYLVFILPWTFEFWGRNSFKRGCNTRFSNIEWWTQDDNVVKNLALLYWFYRFNFQK